MKLTEEQRKKRNAYMSEYYKEMRKKNPNKIHKMKNAFQKTWRAENRAKIRGYENTYAEKHPEKVRAKQIRHKLVKYGLIPEQYDAILASQNGVCAICGLARGIKMLAVDHDHKTNKVRGLLCQFCNTALGKFLDSVEILKRAISYLEKNQDAT